MVLVLTSVFEIVQVLGVFSSLQKAGKQAKAQSHFAFMGSLARVIMPIMTGVLKFHVDYSSAFSLVLILLAVAMAGVVLLYHEIVFFSSPVLASSAIYDTKAAQHQLSAADMVAVGCTAITGAVAVLSMVDWGIVGW